MAGTGALGMLGAGAGGALVGGAVVRLFLDDSQFQGALAKSKAELGSGANAMGGEVSKFGLIAKAAFIVAGLAAVKFAADSVQAAEAHQAALAQLTVAAGANTEAFVHLAEAQVNLTGYTQDASIAAETQLARLHLTADQMTQLLPLVQDYARATGTDLPQAASNIEKAFLGNARALKTVGINFKATGNQATDFAVILHDLQGTVGGASAAYLKTYQGQITLLGAKFEELKVTVGMAIIPILQALVPVLTSIVGVVKTLLPEIVALGAAFLVYKTFTFVAASIQAVSEALLALQTAAIGANAALAGPLAGFALFGVMAVSAQQAQTHLDQLEVSTNAYSKAAAEGNVNSRFFAANMARIAYASDKTTGSTQSLTAAANEQKWADQQLADGIQAVNDALAAQKAAQKALLPGIEGLIGQSQQLAADQKTYNKDLRDNHTPASQIHADQLKLIQDQQGLSDGFKTYAQNLDQSGRSQSQVTAALEKMGEKAGLTAQQVDTLIAKMHILDGLHANAVVTITEQLVQATGTVAGKRGT